MNSRPEKVQNRRKDADDMKKKSMSVMEMGRLIGLKKTTSYWLVNKGLFEVRTVAGKQRVMTDSFYEWLEGQSHYRIITDGDMAQDERVENDGIDS